jgi:hypothetical protein
VIDASFSNRHHEERSDEVIQRPPRDYFRPITAGLDGVAALAMTASAAKKQPFRNAYTEQNS